MRFIKVPTNFLHLSPIRIDNMRVELIEDIKGDFYVSQKSFNWSDFYNKIEKDKSKFDKLTPLYEYVEKAKRVEITIKVTEEEI